MRKVFILSMLALFAAPICAKGEQILVPNHSSKTIKSVPVYDSATARMFGRSLTLTGKAAALRTRDEMSQPFPKYVVQMLVQDGAAYDVSGACTDGAPNADNALKALDAQTFVAVRLDFVTYMSAAELREAFVDSFRANTVDLTAPAIKQFLDLMNANVTERNRWTIATEKRADGDYDLAFEDANGVVSKIVGANLMRRVMSHWMGRLAPGYTQSDFLKSFLCGT